MAIESVVVKKNGARLFLPQLKKKAVHKTITTDDKRLQSTLKRIGDAIPAIEEVNIFEKDVVIQFVNPKVQASIAANTWVVSGTPQNKNMVLFFS